jgi:hypothetical protein
VVGVGWLLLVEGVEIELLWDLKTRHNCSSRSLGILGSSVCELDTIAAQGVLGYWAVVSVRETAMRGNHGEGDYHVEQINQAQKDKECMFSLICAI